MTPCRALPHDPANGQYGDCHRCCVAAILDLEPSAVPHFVEISIEQGRDWAEILREWLAPFGLGHFRFAYLGSETLERVLEITAHNCPGLPLILCGSSPSGVGHTVVIMDGAIIMDPSGCGITGPMEGVYTVEAIGVGANWGAGIPMELAA